MEHYSLTSFIKSDDPLSNTAIEFLLSYREEDNQVDYKESLETSSDKEWYEFTKDVMAFANTEGGYIVFGVRDSSYEVVGLDAAIASSLRKTDMLQQKVNRHVEPSILTIRAKGYRSENKNIVVVFVPQSVGKTHIVSKDAILELRSGSRKTILRKGTMYVRRSGGNHLVDSSDLDEIVNRRMNQFRKSLLSNIARVVEAPPNGEVFILSEDRTSEAHTRYIIQDAPDAIKVKGMSFTVTPSSIEEEIAGHIALFLGDTAPVPPARILWRWYKERERLQLTQEHKLIVGELCLISDVPVFYWFQGCPGDLVREILNKSIPLISSRTNVDIIMRVAAFLGKSAFNKTSKTVQKKHPHRLSKSVLTFPKSGPGYLCSPDLVESLRPKRSKDEKGFREKLQQELNHIAETVVDQNRQPPVMERRLSHAIDCYLYAQKDKYKMKPRKDRKL